jgi:hypothetical protein
VLVAAAVSATASAQDLKLPEIEFGRYHALVIGNNDYEQLPKGRITDIGMQWRRT